MAPVWRCQIGQRGAHHEHVNHVRLPTTRIVLDHNDGVEIRDSREKNSLLVWDPTHGSGGFNAVQRVWGYGSQIMIIPPVAGYHDPRGQPPVSSGRLYSYPRYFTKPYQCGL